MAPPGSGGDVVWGEDEEDGAHGGVKEAFRSKPRFSYTEVKLLLDEVKKNRHILLSESSVSPSPWQPHQNLCSDAVSNVSVSSCVSWLPESFRFPFSKKMIHNKNTIFG